MKIPFVRRSAFEALEAYSDTAVWTLKKQVKRLREREAARIVCMDALERGLEETMAERDRLRRRVSELEREGDRIADENRTLRRNYDRMRAELSRARHENTELSLMKGSLEARLAAACEIEN